MPSARCWARSCSMRLFTSMSSVAISPAPHHQLVWHNRPRGAGVLVASVHVRVWSSAILRRPGHGSICAQRNRSCVLYRIVRTGADVSAVGGRVAQTSVSCWRVVALYAVPQDSWATFFIVVSSTGTGRRCPSTSTYLFGVPKEIVEIGMP